MNDSLRIVSGIFERLAIMAKKTTVAAAVESTLPATTVEYKSYRDFGYSVAGKSDAVRADGAWALDNIKGFPDSIEPEPKSELYEGFRQRYSEQHPEVEYAVIDGNYLPVSQLSPDVKILERLNIGVIHAFSYSQQAFGALKEIDLQKYELLKGIRTKVNKYCFNCLDDLKAAARKVLKHRNPETTTRAATDAFNVAAAKMLSKMKERVKSAAARGDVSADAKALDAAIIAFKTKYETATGHAVKE
jgi:hypothetical protein